MTDRAQGNMKLRDIAARIDAHLKRFEADKSGVNVERTYSNNRGQASKLRSYFGAGSGYAGGRYIFVRYVCYQDGSHITKEEALRYLAWLDAGNVGRHYEALRGEGQ